MMQQAGQTGQLGRDPVLEMMLEEGLPLTETVYLEMQYPEGIPNPVPPELLAAMPPEVKGKKGDEQSSEEMSMPSTGIVDQVAKRHGLTASRAEELIQAFGG